MKNLHLLAAIAALMVLSCSKEPDTDIQNSGERKSSSLLTNFSGYEIWSAPWTIQNEIFNVSPDPDPDWQALNENIYYTGYALKEMIRSGAYPHLVSDIKQNLDANSELLVNNFFKQYPNYEAVATALLWNVFNVSFKNIIDNPINVGGTDYSPSLLIPENTLNGQQDRPVIAMGIELIGPDHDEEEDYGEDFIPAFWYGDEDYTETAIGYDDSKDYKTEEIITVVIVVTSAAVLATVGNWLVNINLQAVDPNSIIGTPGNTSGPNCELSGKLTCTQMTCTQRFQRWGKSRVRMGYAVDHPSDPAIDFEAKKKYKIGNMKKSEVTKTFNTPFSLSGHDYLATVPERNQPPNGYYFLVMTYEYDWYGTRKGYSVEIPGTTIRTAVIGRMKKAHEFYQRMWVPDYDWCYLDDRTYTSSGYAIFKGF